MSMVDSQVVVPVIIKAPNQKIGDLLVNCNSDWTVHELKSHLSQVYPSKPHPNGQKLIYSGKLLSDNMIINDVLKSYNGQQNNTIHLVCSLTKENIFYENKNLNKDNFVKTSSERVFSKPESSSCSGEPSINYYAGFKYIPTNSSKDYTHIHNERAYLMNSYLQYISQHMHWSAANKSPPVFLTNEDPQENLRNNINNQPENEENIPDEERQANRDWLDWVYILSRLIVLFTVVYFYSSPLRCIMVTAMALILYHLGMFRLRQFPINNIFNFNNNNINNNANEQEGADEVVEDVTNNRDTDVIIERFGLLKTIINFIFTFLLSLVPDNREN